MKLIDLLVQELPKRGGWPEGAVECERYLHEAQIDFYDKDGNWGADCGKVYGHDFAADCVKPREKGDGVKIERVTREQYEEALAAAQQPLWNGEGLPPVGCECEGKQFAQINWTKFRVVAIANNHVFGFWNDSVAVGLSPKMWEFRPIRSEAERKRDETITKMRTCLAGTGAGITEHASSCLYDAIARGDIPGIKLSD